MKNLPLLLALSVAPVFAACSLPSTYGTGQTWQRERCNKINDHQERSRCQSSASTPYEEYKRQSDKAKGTP